MLRKCTLLYALDREEEFKSYYQECLKATEKHGETRRNELNKLKIYNYILNQQYDKAHALADSTSSLHERIAYQANIYAKEQKYKDAYESLQKLHSLSAYTDCRPVGTECAYRQRTTEKKSASLAAGKHTIKPAKDNARTAANEIASGNREDERRK